MARTMLFGLLSAALLALAIYDGRVADDPPPDALPATRAVSRAVIHRPDEETRRAGDAVMGYTSARDSSMEAEAAAPPRFEPVHQSVENLGSKQESPFTPAVADPPRPRAIPSLASRQAYPATAGSTSSPDRAAPVAVRDVPAVDTSVQPRAPAHPRIERLPPVNDIRPRLPLDTEAAGQQPVRSAVGPQAPVPRLSQPAR